MMEMHQSVKYEGMKTLKTACMDHIHRLVAVTWIVGMIVCVFRMLETVKRVILW